MYRIIDSRASGKTSRLMLLAKETGATIVCSNPRAMETKAHAYGIVGIDFMDYATYLNTKGMDCGKIMIDEMEAFVKFTIGSNCGQSELIGYTLSNGD